MRIKIYKANATLIHTKQKLSELLPFLPTSLYDRAKRYKDERAAYNFVIGRLLLKQGLADYGFSDDLEKLQFRETGKPYFDGIHFNISHSGDQVMCCFSLNREVGFDIEQIQEVSFDDFTTMFTHQEWKVIRGATNPLRKFYWYWTRKESIIKALGLTLGFLHKIELDASLDYFLLNGNKWYLKAVDLENEYVGTVCCTSEINAIEFIDLKDFKI